MNSIIRLLPDHIANQIAAGEVIQRPASVIKELMENAIDADATHIDVIIKDAGKTLIQVVDNGKGMSELDARMAFERHATSKVKEINDLFCLQTKGFRGEALASIAAIAHVELNTRTIDDELGTRIQIEGTKIVNQEQIICKQGSSFIIKNLFFNIPARRNFLKSDAIEYNHIEQEFIRVALAHPQLNFSLTHNDNNSFKLAEGNLRKRIVELFGKSINDKLVPVSESTDIVSISGFIGKPENAKKSRGEQYFFVNNRYFKDAYFNHAVNAAFENLILPKTFASYFLFFDVDPSSIDVNVHPTKTEIKFEEDKEIYAILKSTIKLSLGKFNIAPTLDFEKETSFELPYEMLEKQIVLPTIQVNSNYNPFHANTYSSSGNGMSPGMKAVAFGNQKIKKEEWAEFYNFDQIREESDDVKMPIEFNEEKEGVNQFIIKDNILLTPTKSGLLLINTKYAWERIIYDEIMQKFISTALNSQQLLFPLFFECSESVKLIWEENKTSLERMGFSWNNIEKGLEIIGAPSEIEETNILDTVEEIASKLNNSTLDKGEIAHEIALGIATSKASQKKRWNNESVSYLIDTLFALPENQFSPSGIKIMNTLSSQELIKFI